MCLTGSRNFCGIVSALFSSAFMHAVSSQSSPLPLVDSVLLIIDLAT